MIGLLFAIVFIVVVIAGMWMAFQKAGQPGWACLVPIYSQIILCQIAGKPGWWFLLFFIPIVGVIFAIIVGLATAEAYGKGVGFGIGLILLGFIFWPILGFGSAQYVGAKPVATY
ncbi:MAG: signal peptidase I [Planctomycetes bacterium]|nr:signal peptidase I [Planctomycetota bacterium]